MPTYPAPVPHSTCGNPTIPNPQHGDGGDPRSSPCTNLNLGPVNGELGDTQIIFDDTLSKVTISFQRGKLPLISVYPLPSGPPGFGGSKLSVEEFCDQIERMALCFCFFSRSSINSSVNSNSSSSSSRNTNNNIYNQHNINIKKKGILDTHLRYRALVDIRKSAIPAMRFHSAIITKSKELRAKLLGSDFDKRYGICSILLNDNLWAMATKSFLQFFLMAVPPKNPLLLTHTEQAAMEFFDDHHEEIMAKGPPYMLKIQNQQDEEDIEDMNNINININMS